MLDKNDLSRAQRYASSALLLLDHCFGAQRVNRVFGGRKRALQEQMARRLSATGEGKLIPVPRCRGLSPEVFRAKYLRPGLPVVLEGAARLGTNH